MKVRFCSCLAAADKKNCGQTFCEFTVWAVVRTMCWYQEPQTQKGCAWRSWELLHVWQVIDDSSVCKKHQQVLLCSTLQYVTF